MGTPTHSADSPSGDSSSPSPIKTGFRVVLWASLVLVLIAVVAGIGLYVAKHGFLAKAGSNHSGSDSLGLATSVAALSPEQRQQAYKDEVEAIASRLGRLQAYLDGFPRALTDVEALGQILTTPQAAFEFVRDHVALEPYPGIMKGVRATLITRGGNSLERALLLAALLKQNGVSVKIAHGNLSPEQAQKLLQQIATEPGSVEQVLQSLSNSAPSTGLTDHQREFGKSLDQRGEQSGSALLEAVKKNLPLVQSALKKAGLPSDATSRQLEALEDHYWVQATVDDQAIDLDPSLKSASANQRLTDPVETFDPDSPADTLFQHVQFRLVGEFLDSGTLQSKELLSKQINAADLFGKNIRLAIEATSAKASEAKFKGVLLVDDDRTDGDAFRLSESSSEIQGGSSDGTSGADTGAAGASGGLLGGLGGDEDQTPAAKPQAKAKPVGNGVVLARLSLDVTSAGPHLAETHYQRVILDRLEASSAKLRIAPALTEDRAVRALLAQAWDGAVSVGSTSPVFVLATRLATAKAQQAIEEKARARLYLGQTFSVDDLPGPMLSPQLIDYYFSSDVDRFLIAQHHGAKAKSYYERPRLAFFRHGFVVADWGRAKSEYRFAQGIDLLNSPFQFVGTADDAQQLAMEAGIVDTALERLTVQPDRSFNTIPLFAAASDQDVSILTITPDQKSTVDGMAIPSAIKNALAAELAQGQMLILPSRLVKLNEVQTFGWWSVDPATGMALGKMELGGAQAMTETTELNERIEKWTEIFTKFYGGLLQCYMQAIGSGIEAMNDLNPIPDSELAECVISATCDAIADIIAEAAVSPAFAEEAEAEIRPLRKIIEEWAEEQIAEGAAKWSVAKACEERAGRGE